MSAKARSFTRRGVVACVGLAVLIGGVVAWSGINVDSSSVISAPNSELATTAEAAAAECTAHNKIGFGERGNSNCGGGSSSGTGGHGSPQLYQGSVLSHGAKTAFASDIRRILRDYTSDARELSELVAAFLAEEEDSVQTRFRTFVEERTGNGRQVISNALDVILQAQVIFVAFLVGALAIGGFRGRGRGGTPTTLQQQQGPSTNNLKGTTRHHLQEEDAAQHRLQHLQSHDRRNGQQRVDTSFRKSKNGDGAENRNDGPDSARRRTIRKSGA